LPDAGLAVNVPAQDTNPGINIYLGIFYLSMKLRIIQYVQLCMSTQKADTAKLGKLKR
jgi:hypothetical protein